MTIFNVWKDDEEKIRIEARGIHEALDKAAVHFGYVDYLDMAQEMDWCQDDPVFSGRLGLNIEVAETE